MPAILPLRDLAQRIYDQEAELIRLREELESRQNLLAQLESRRAELLDQLAEVESAINEAGASSVPLRPPVKSEPIAKRGRPAGGNRMSLARFLVELVRNANGPVTSKDLHEEAIRLKYPTTSKNFRSVIETRLVELVKAGVLARLPDQSGVVLGEAADTGAAEIASSDEGKGAKKKVRSEKSGKKKSLQAVITKILARSNRPLPSKELARRILRSGYETKSSDFKNVVWVALSKMENVERIPREGYRLKTS